jgi:serine phosphatase RsbU (regulator of sigma subunit)
MIDPVKLKKILITVLKVLIVVELISALSQGTSSGGWARLGFDLLVAGVLYVMWEKMRVMVRDKKEDFRRKVERSTQDVKLWDALVFSLLWSDQIYKDIPGDRRRLVVISYTLIALGLVAAFVKIGTGLMPLVVSGALVLGAVNLLAWVVSAEREEKETLQTELKLAHDVQVSLMPKEQPSLRDYDIAGVSIPAKEVGGDHFDYTNLNSGADKFGISVFDVSGKGMQAAMSAVFTSGAFASEAKQSVSPAEILTRLNKAVFDHSKRGHFVAFLLAMLDTNAKSVTFANAGQTKPLLITSGDARWLDSVGVHFPLGMKDQCSYQECSIPLHSGDILCLLTDGFTEAMNPAQEQYGMERIERLVKDLVSRDLSARELLERATAEVRSHVGSASQHDDMTMVVVKVK